MARRCNLMACGIFSRWGMAFTSPPELLTKDTASLVSLPRTNKGAKIGCARFLVRCQRVLSWARTCARHFVGRLAYPLAISSELRAFAISAALGMAGALYTSVRLDEDWLRAALYLIVFVTLTLTGPGKFSIDRWLQ